MNTMPLHKAAWTGAARCVRSLLEAGANIEAKTHNLYTPLHKAARKNQVEVISILISWGCEREAQTAAGWTALHVAGLGGCVEAAQALLAHNLDPTARDAKGRTPATVADVWGRSDAHWFFSKLPKVVFDASLAPATGMFKEDSRAIYEDNEKAVLRWAQEGKFWKLKDRIPNIRDGHYQDHRGYTALHVAAHRGDETTVRVLLEDRCLVYPGALTYSGHTPADLARLGGFSQLADLIQDALHSSKSGEVEERHLYGRLLELICHGDDVQEACQLLLQGAPLEATAEYPTHALVLAVTSNRPRILSLLVAAGAPLTPVVCGLNLLQLAWLSPDVTTYVKMLVTRAMEHVLEEEAGRVRGQAHGLYEGITRLLGVVKGPRPWLAAWPSLHPPSQHQHTQVPPSPQLMVAAAEADCRLTTVFLEQAGAMPFTVHQASGLTAINAALRASHWHLATHLAKTSGSLYIPSAPGAILPRDLLPEDKKQKLEKEIYDQERRILTHHREKVKDREDKDAISSVIHLQTKLYKAYCRSHHTGQQERVSVAARQVSPTLLLASQMGLVQLTFLLVTIGGVDVNIVVEPLTGTTPLHQAAAFGHTSLLAFFLSIIDPSHVCPDNYNRSPTHLAALFGHDQTFEYLSHHFHGYTCKAGNTHTEVRNNFIKYLQLYQKVCENAAVDEDPWRVNSCSEAVKHHFQSLNMTDILNNNKEVNFMEGEAAEVRSAVMKELQVIMERVSDMNPLLQGELELLGSSADGTRLYGPDEYDVNYVIKDLPALEVKVVRLVGKNPLKKGHSLSVRIKTKNKEIKHLLKKSNWKNMFFEAVQSAVEHHEVVDHRLSFVPPGVTRTKVGAGLALAWQGQQYPLLLVGVDLVPVMKVRWPKGVDRPFLIPHDQDQVYLTSIGGGEWRFSFAGIEASILRQLDIHERRTFLSCKTLLSCMKPEPWMTKHLKRRFRWWDSRYWNIPAPCGFALKNCFFMELEKKRKHRDIWTEDKLVERMCSIFRRMCEDCTDPSTNSEQLVPHKVFAYFGGKFERPKLGVGAPEIVKHLNKYAMSRHTS
ncbi:serine/threonine-protein phosphatase 6 regulatory ankyrin repeat subunit C isoform X2 [Procambarus clarkii]|uniref:serine/threonine-protein phosphatase 6 regulatory ankyrin repeat subunit C isoform X2 n=1 Tax=Procambarus clarkii TaxID=6728 RepID=UPI001E670241|nr:ankyrin-1-like isoform X2 [Procambarus clarkii]